MKPSCWHFQLPDANGLISNFCPCSLTEMLEQFENVGQRGAGALAQEFVERHESYIRLRNQLREAEERLAETSSTAMQRVELLRQLKEDLARSNETLQAQHARIVQLEADATIASQRLVEIVKENDQLRTRAQGDDIRVQQGISSTS